MNKREKRLHSPAPGDLQRLVLDSLEQRQLCLVKVENAGRRRLKVQEKRYTCFGDGEGKGLSDDFEGSVTEVELKNGKNSASEVFLSLSSSSSSSKNNNVAFVKTTAGALLDLDGKPAKESEDLAAKRLPCVSYGLVSVSGRRREMEDAARAELGFLVREKEKYDFFGVYDGHGGARVAQACKERLHRFLVEELDAGSGEGIEWKKVMERCFEKMDEEVMSSGGEMRTMGSTAVVAVVGKAEVVVANCGDSRAVMSRDGVAVALSDDHKPDRSDELARIEAAGGKVINWNGQRVCGVLATSRSIGDQYLKPYVIARPEVIVCGRDDKDDFLILASDGLWDVVSNEVACQVVRTCFRNRRRRRRRRENGQDFVKESDAAKAAAVLAKLAMKCGSNDNISVIVVDLSNSNSLS